MTSISDGLKHFSEITLKEMSNFKLMDRVETKFVLSVKQLPAILWELRHDYMVVNISGELTPSYKTVYFDTESYHFYHEHHRKRNNRYKVRFRNYVASNLTFLEVKHKKNGRVNKQRIKVSNTQFELNEVEKTFLESVNIHQSDLKPSLINNYQRITLVSKHSIERVTFDLNIDFKSDGNESSLDNIVIVELKQDALSRTSKIYQVLRNAQIKPYSVSKYCLGLIKTVVEEKIKYNRFKKKLIQLNKINRL